MKVALLSPANSIHTIRWANGLSEEGLDIHVISCHEIEVSNVKYNKNVKVHILKSKAPLAYFSAKAELKQLLFSIQPDILNAHYATGYGFLARLSEFHPLLLSVWGSDVYEFPNKSILHKLFLKKNLKNADAIASTSHCMAVQTAKTYSHSKIFVTPFGIDDKRFYPFQKHLNNDFIQIGTVKTLSEKYGIDTLIEAFAISEKQCIKHGINIRLSIVGSGEDEYKLKMLSKELGLQDKITFAGYIANENIPRVLNSFDIYVALSRWNSESFGVAVLEASACGLPVVVSDADGLKEVVLDLGTGLIVAKDNPQLAADALIKLINDNTLRERLGLNGRKHVLQHYTWEKSLEAMIKAYQATIKVCRK